MSHKICVWLQIIDPQSWEMIFGRMKALPSSVRHIVMVTTVPVVYPQVSFWEVGRLLVMSTFFA